MDRRPLFMLSTELHRRTSLTPDGRPEKSGETPGRTTSKVLEFRHTSITLPPILASGKGNFAYQFEKRRWRVSTWRTVRKHAYMDTKCTADAIRIMACIAGYCWALNWPLRRGRNRNDGTWQCIYKGHHYWA